MCHIRSDVLVVTKTEIRVANAVDFVSHNVFIDYF
jgi:hypothetical protein